LLFALLGLGIYLIFVKPYESTDNAYINANVIPIAAQISGPILNCYVENNQKVKANDILFEIDPKPFQLEVDNAQAQLELMGNEVAKAASDVDQAIATLHQHQAEMQRLKLNNDRVMRLVGRKVVPQDAADNAAMLLKAATAAQEAAQAELAQARILLGKVGGENEQIRIATAALEKAKLNLNYTKIRAPASGKISNYSLQPGQYVMSGMSQFAIISDELMWVDANYKETQVGKMQSGQDAYITVDMYPDKVFHGVIESISGASGTSFSLLPPQNATGNWVKITQRVPVKVVIDDVDEQHPLVIGTSATVKIKTR
jgi:membrane fusion protein (multidrug efflux system)